MDKTISCFIEDIIDDHLKEYWEEDKSIQQIRKRAFEVSKKERYITEKLEEQDIAILMEYEALRNEEEGMQYHYLYLEGMKDGIKLLKYLGLL